MTDTTPIIRKRVRRALQPVANAVPPSARNWPAGGPDLDLEYVATDKLRTRERHARKHSDKQLAQIEASIRQFGFTSPILVDVGDKIVAGVGRWQAAKKIGLAAVPVVRLEHLTEAEVRAYAIADNKLAELSGWDEDVLRLELGELIALDADFDIEITGFETVEIDNLLLAGGTPVADPDDELPDNDSKVPVSQLDDMFILGDHKLICGDARQADVYARLLGDERARMVFSDAPYNVKIKGNVCGLGKVKHDEFAMASGEMSRAEFTDFLTTVFRQLAAFSLDGAIHFQAMDWRSQIEMVTAGEAAYSELKNLIVWKKDNAGMGAFYRSHFELIYAWKVGRAKHLNNFGLGQSGRYRTNVWSYPGVNTLRKGRMDDLAAHPTVKPTGLVADAIRDVSKRGDIVIDPFCGSGTTIMAAERTGRRARCIELEPKFVDVAIRRWEKATGKTAIHADSGLTLDELATDRSVAAPTDGGAGVE
jgi:DNA modification methylase